MTRNFSKAQIGIFVIVSVIIVIIAITLISLNSDSIKIFADQKSSYKVKEFVESCLEQETQDAVKQIGLHGGWLYHKDTSFTDRKNPEEINKKAEGIDLLEQNKMPYWFYYDDSSQNFMLNIPEYDTNDQYSLKNQVKRYLEENLDKDCIMGFSAFDDIYNIDYEPKSIAGRVEVEFDEDEITSSLDLPLTIHELNTENVESIDYFSSDVENKLWVPYHLAFDITMAEVNNSFLENRMLFFLGPYQTTESRDLLPPFYDFQFNKYDFAPWSVPKVETLVKQIIEVNIGNIQFLNTNYSKLKMPQTLDDNEFVQGFKGIFVKDYLSDTSITKKEAPKLFKQYKDYNVKPTYQSSFYPSSFKLSPSLGNSILLPTAESVLGFLPFFFTEYVAVYQMTLPVTFEIKPDGSYDDFVFNFPIETNIDYNKPLAEAHDIQFDFSNLGIDDTNTQSLICDRSQFVSKPIYLNISDPVDFGNRKSENDIKVGVADASVTFNCKGLTTCFIEQTKVNGKYIQNNITQLELRLPTNCYPGTLEVSKYGYKKLTIENLDPNTQDIINLGEKYMPSQKTLNLKVHIVEPQDSIYELGVGIDDSDTGFLIFTNLEDEDITQIVKINKVNIDDLKIDLTTGHYKVEGFLLHNDLIQLPSDKVCYTKDLFSGEECETIPAMNFSSWVRAGIEVDDFEIPQDFLLARDTITVNLVNYGIPQKISDLDDITKKMSDVKSVSQAPYFN